MTGEQAYAFRAATLDDLDLLRGWQAQPHVAAWWDTDDPFDQDDLLDKRVARWIVSLKGRPFAYMQDYAVHGWTDHHFYDLPEGTRGIDQYIGVAEMLGQGHGPGFIGARVQAMFDAGLPVVATDPHPGNSRAIAAYEKLGFGAFGPPQETQWGVILPMKLVR